MEGGGCGMGRKHGSIVGESKQVEIVERFAEITVQLDIGVMPSTTCFKCPRWSLEWPRWPSVSPPAPSRTTATSCRRARLRPRLIIAAGDAGIAPLPPPRPCCGRRVDFAEPGHRFVDG